METNVIAVVGMGYVGLPLAVALSRFFDVVGYDINKKRIDELKAGSDHTLEVDERTLSRLDRLRFVSREDELGSAQTFIITVPTPIDDSKNPDLAPLISATESIARYVKSGMLIIYESTVYPGCTEEVCIPILESVSGMSVNRDFHVGYSPERINPGDPERSISDIVKITSGSCEAAAQRVSDIYPKIISAGIHRAQSIKVAEAAKVIENTQRDLNIALMNELSLIFDLLSVNTHEVLAAAATKWNFLPFKPGLVGGHCIGVDPYYLTHKAEAIGYRPEIILAGRRLNDAMPERCVTKLVKTMCEKNINPCGARVLILGVTFKEDCPDVRNSKVFDLVPELMTYKCEVYMSDPLVSADDLPQEYVGNFTRSIEPAFFDAVVVAVAHREYRNLQLEGVLKYCKNSCVVYDIKGVMGGVDGRVIQL